MLLKGATDDKFLPAMKYDLCLVAVMGGPNGHYFSTWHHSLQSSLTLYEQIVDIFNALLVLYEMNPAATGSQNHPDSKVYGANVGHIWGR